MENENLTTDEYENLPIEPEYADFDGLEIPLQIFYQLTEIWAKIAFMGLVRNRGKIKVHNFWQIFISTPIDEKCVLFQKYTDFSNFAISYSNVAFFRTFFRKIIKNLNLNLMEKL